MTIFICLLACFGFWLIFNAWGVASSLNLRVATGWLAIIIASALLMFERGFEHGLVYSLFGFSLIPLTIVGLNTQIRSVKKKKVEAYSAIYISRLHMIQNIGHFVVAVPISFAAALLASLLTSQIFAWSMVNKLAYVVLILPLLWAILIYAYFYTKKRLSSAIAIIFAMLLMLLYPLYLK